MKNVYTFILSFTFLFLGISSEAQTTKLGIILVDKTTSVTIGEEVNSKYKTELEDIISNYTQTEGDRIILSYIYGNTLNPANKIIWSFSPPNLKEEKRSSSDQKLAEINHRTRIRSYGKGYKKKIEHAFFDSTNDSTGTKIFGSLKNLERFISSNPNCEIKVFIYSDLKEYSEICKQYTEDGVVYGSRKEAEKYAISDLKKAIERYQINIEAFASISSLSIILPALSLDRDLSFEYLVVFWSKVFKELGITNISFQ